MTSEEGEKQGILVEIAGKITFGKHLDGSYGNCDGYYVQEMLASQLLCYHISIPRGVIKPFIGNVFSTLKITART